MARDYEGMQEQQWSNSQRAAQDGPWAGYDPEVVDYYRSNTPAGFGSWASGMAPGQTLDPRQVQEVIGNLNRPGLYEGVNGMTLLQYLADPRSHIKYEDGKFTYAPKTTREDLGNDFKSKDRETFLQSLGAIPMIAGMMAGPFMQTAGIGKLGAMGAAAGSAGAEFFPNVGNFLGDMATTGASAFTPGAGSFEMSVDGGQFTNEYNLPNDTGNNWYDTSTTDLSNSSNVGQTQNLGPIDPSAKTWTDFTGPVNPTNINITPGGMTEIKDMINQITSGGANLTGIAEPAAAASLLSQISKYLGIPIDEMVKKATGNPFLETLVKGYGIYTAGQANDKASGIVQQGMAQSDPFGPQRQFYQDQLKQSYLDPNFFNNSAQWKGITNNTINDVSKLYAARGMNDSSNVIVDTARRLADERSKYALNWQNQTGQLAGGGVSPSGIGALAGLGANLATQQGNQQSGNVGSFIRTLPNTIDYLDKTFSGVSPP